jgi:hypothetical protein
MGGGMLSKTWTVTNLFVFNLEKKGILKENTPEKGIFSYLRGQKYRGPMGPKRVR